MKYINLLGLILLAALVAACSTTNAPTTGGPQTVEGGYTPIAPWYRLIDNQLCAWDGKDWYQLRTPYFPTGTVGGAETGWGEVWIKPGGSRIEQYHRTPETFRDQTKQPVFVRY